MAELNACLKTTRRTGIEVATMHMEHSATAQIMALYDSTVNVSNDLCHFLGGLT